MLLIMKTHSSADAAPSRTVSISLFCSLAQSQSLSHQIPLSRTSSLQIEHHVVELPSKRFYFANENNFRSIFSSAHTKSKLLNVSALLEIRSINPTRYDCNHFVGNLFISSQKIFAMWFLLNQPLKLQPFSDRDTPSDFWWNRFMCGKWIGCDGFRFHFGFWVEKNKKNVSSSENFLPCKMVSTTR